MVNGSPYVLYPEGTLWKSRADGSERLQLTFAPLIVLNHFWSPDGKFISFSAFTPQAQSMSYKISSSGGQPEPLTNNDHFELTPSWSPDGQSVAFSYAPFIEKTPETLGVYVFNLTTLEKQKVPDSDGFFAPAWSPTATTLPPIPCNLNMSCFLISKQRNGPRWIRAAA